MDIRELKEKIYNDEKVVDILYSIGMHNIKEHDNGRYITCSWRNGDNPSGCVVYCNEYLNVTGNTRKIVKNDNISPDIVTLVQFVEQIKLFDAIKFICDVMGIDVHDDLTEDLPLGMQFMKDFNELLTNGEAEEDVKIRVRDECMLSYYKHYVNDFFKRDNISYSTQYEFEIGYDDFTNRITIPIRDEYGSLVGVKGRLFKNVLDEDDIKYIYIEKTPRNKILYGLYKTYDAIVRSGSVYVCESEKGVMQLWTMGYQNAVATGGSHIGREQIEKLTRLGVKIILAFDKDIKQSDKQLSNEEDGEITLEGIADRFINGIEVYAIIDTINILNEKESPTDDCDKWIRLKNECLYKLK